MKYNLYNNYELMYLAQLDDYVVKLLYENNIALITHLANELIDDPSKIGVDFNDMVQEGMIALNKAITTYDSYSTISFCTYAWKCIENGLKTFIRNNRSKNNSILNNSCSLSSASEIQCLSKEVLDIIEYEEFRTNFLRGLKGLEKRVVKCKMMGYKNYEITKMLNISKVQLNNAIMRIKKKLQKAN